MAKSPSQIYAIQAYSKSLHVTKRIFDEDSLAGRHTTGSQKRLAQQKAEAFAAQLNTQKHQGATDWVAKPVLQDYRPDGITRGAQIRNLSRPR